MKNIEIKAKCEDLQRAENTAKNAGAKFDSSIHQLDTYFIIKNGRLKLREISLGESQLIYYNRPNQTGPKTSSYQIYPAADPEQLKEILDAAIGTWKIVDKERIIYLFDEVRIHFDKVKGLGSFLELEGVLSPDADENKVREKVDWLIDQLEIQRNDLIDGSYSDLI